MAVPALPMISPFRRAIAAGMPSAPSIERDRMQHDLARRRLGERAGDDEDGRPGRMVGPFDERQTRDHFRRLGGGEPHPPGAGRRARLDPEHAEIARRPRDGLDDARRAVVRHIGHGEAEMEPRRIAHRRVAAGNIGMDAVIGLHIGEGRNDDAPDALDRVERQQPAVALGDAAHHLGFAPRPERRAAALLRLDLDQPVDDLAALDQQRMHCGVDPVDLDAQAGKRLVGASGEVFCGDVSGSLQGQGRIPVFFEERTAPVILPAATIGKAASAGAEVATPPCPCGRVARSRRAAANAARAAPRRSWPAEIRPAADVSSKSRSAGDGGARPRAMSPAPQII